MTIGFAHRGARLEHPDSTLAGFARALELGATAVESDAWVSADGVAVLDHDGVVRHGLRRRPISAHHHLDLPPSIPTLAALLDLVGDAQVSLDVKDPAAAAAVLAAASQARHRGRLWLCHPEVATLAGWLGRDASGAGSEGVGDVALVHSTGLARIGGRAGVAGHARRLASEGIAALNLRCGEWGEPEVAACHDARVAAFAWDAQTPGELRRLVGLDLDAVYSDHVADMVAALRP